MNFKMNRGIYSKSVARPHHTRETLKMLARYLLKYKWLLLFAFLGTVVSNLLALVGPYLSGLAIDEIIGVDNVNFSAIYKISILMGICFVGSSFLSYLISYLMIYISTNISRRMRMNLFERLMKFPISFFDTVKTGDIISRLSYDIDTVNTSLSSDVITIFSSIITMIVSLVMMLIIAPLLVLVFLVTIPLSFFMTKHFAGRARKYFRDRSIQLGDLNGFVEEYLTGLKTIKVYHQEENIIKKFTSYNLEAADASYKADYYSAPIGPGVNFINNLSLALISIFGSFLSIAELITLGNISSFILYSRKFSGPINEIANLFQDLQSSIAACERVLSLELEKIEVDTSTETLEVKEGNVTFENVTFGYLEDKTILHDITFNIKGGDTIAIVGPTGAGKTTIINLLMRFYELNSGKILVDGYNIADCNIYDVRTSYAMVLQDTWTFTGSIYENLLYGSETKTKEDVIHVCKAAHIHNFILSLPNGYDTILTEDGINISKGQKQLLTIARAMLLDRKMLILDEATSNVDTKTEKDIQNSMLKLMKNKTTFVIAHRLSTIQNADLILVVRDGDIVEMGTHQDLLDQQGYYASLYQSQY